MDDGRQEKNFLLIIFFIIQAIIIIVLISLVLIFKQNSKIKDTEYSRQPSITIVDLVSKLPETPKTYVDILERELARTVELNSQNYNSSDTEAIIRENSLHVQQFRELEGYFLNAIIDIPNLQQSYQIYYHYPAHDSPPNSTPSNMMYVLCLDKQEETKYQNFDCKDLYQANIRRLIVSNYLKYFNFDYFSARIDADNSNTIIISPSVTYDNDETTKSRYIEEAKTAISSLGVSPDQYKYYVRTAADVNYDNPD